MVKFKCCWVKFKAWVFNWVWWGLNVRVEAVISLGIGLWVMVQGVCWLGN